MDDAGVTLVDGVPAAGNSVAHRCPLHGTFATDDVILAAASTHNVPLGARAVVIQVPVIYTQTGRLLMRSSVQVKQENESNLGKYDKVEAAVDLVSWTLKNSVFSLSSCCHVVVCLVKITSLLCFIYHQSFI